MIMFVSVRYYTQFTTVSIYNVYIVAVEQKLFT